MKLNPYLEQTTPGVTNTRKGKKVGKNLEIITASIQATIELYTLETIVLEDPGTTIRSR